jgi:hypothetical protein
VSIHLLLLLRQRWLYSYCSLLKRMHSFGVGYWSQTKDGNFSQRRLLAKSAENCIVRKYVLSIFATDDVIASHCTCLAILLRKPGATVKLKNYTHHNFTFY